MKRIVVLLLCLLLCGCSAQSDVYVPTGDALADDAGYNPLPTQNDGQQELTLVYYPEQSLNPYTCSDFTNRALFSLVYQGLFTTDRNYNVTPMLCSRFTVSADMRTYTFYTEEATFSDGSRVTAEDVLASLVAASENSVYAGRFAHVEQMTLSSDGGVQIRLDTDYEDLPILLDIPIVRAEDVAQPMPIGSGPYYWDSTAGALLLRRCSNWWCTTALPVTAETITLQEAESPAHIRDSFEFSDVGLVCANPGSGSYVDYRCDFELWESENGIFLYLACNTQSEVFGDVAVRSKLTHAIDRDLLADAYYRGFARSACLPASPTSPYYSNQLAARYGYDSEQFTQALTEAMAGGKTVRLLVNKGDNLRLQVGRHIARMLTDCGLKVELVAQTGEDYLYTLSSRNYDLYLGQTKLSPNMDLSCFFGKNAPLRYGGMTDAGMYALCLESLANRGNYYNLHQTVMEDGRLCPVLFQSYSIYATRGLLQGLEPARDSVFYYTTGKLMVDVRVELE